VGLAAEVALELVEPEDVDSTHFWNDDLGIMNYLA
jgi:hypothetical protein